MPELEGAELEEADAALLLSTHDLRGRGWTAALIRDFLALPDAARPNLMRLGRRRLPPVKLYRAERVDEVEASEAFLVAQARAMEARERAERALSARRTNKARQIEAWAQAWQPNLTPRPLRRGAYRKAYSAHEDALEEARARALAQLQPLSGEERRALEAQLQARYAEALSTAYPWLRRTPDRDSAEGPAQAG